METIIPYFIAIEIGIISGLVFYISIDIVAERQKRMEQVHADLPETEEAKLTKERKQTFFAILLDEASAYDCTVSAKTKRELAQTIAKAMELNPERKICGIFQGKSIAHRPVTKIELL